jgi:hypothetical protein
MVGIRDIWYSDPPNPDDTIQVSNHLSSLNLFLQWRGPPPISLLCSHFSCGLLTEIFKSFRSDECREKALQVICHILTHFPQTLPIFLECDLPRVMLAFLENVNALKPRLRDTAPYQVLCMCGALLHCPPGIELFLNRHNDHLSFFDHFLKLLDQIVQKNGELSEYGQKTESRIYEVFADVGSCPALDPFYIEVIVNRYSRVFALERDQFYAVVCRSLQSIWFARRDRRDLILESSISGPICIMLSNIRTNPQEVIPEALPLALEILIVDCQFSSHFCPHELFEIAQLFSHEADQTCDRALHLLSLKLLVDRAVWPRFDHAHLLNFCSAQFADDVDFSRKASAARMVLATAEVFGLLPFMGHSELIVCAFEVIESADPDLVSAGISASWGLAMDVVPNDPVLSAVVRFLVSVNEDERARAVLERLTCGSARKLLVE